MTLLLVLLIASHVAMAQEKLSQDTLQCHIIGFSAGLLTPSSNLSNNSGGLQGGSMYDLYKGPYLDFALECDYKYKSNLLVTLDADMWFGLNSNNLRDREKRMGDVFTSQGYAMSWGGYDGAMTFYNRGFAVRLGIGKVFTVMKKNPNSGILVKGSGGWIQQKTAMVQDFNESPVPQLSGRYARLYDHNRMGGMLTQSVGFWYMSNHFTYVNFKITFDVSECLTWSTRPYVLDNLTGQKGKDNNTYFDLIYGLKITWMFPLTGKTTYDYYYF